MAIGRRDIAGYDPAEDGEPSSYDQIITAYYGAAGELAERYDALPPGAAFGEVQHLFCDGGTAPDVGAGLGRDARWLASLGLEVVAV